MSSEHIAAAVTRVQTVLRRRPDMGLQDDAPATAVWQDDTRVVVAHENGTRVATDIARELGGTGELVTAGWLFRAGLASCATTSIALAAAAQGIDLIRLEVGVSSRSDTRGLLGMADESGELVAAGPREITMSVRIAAPAVAAERLRALVEAGCRSSPIPDLVERATPLVLRIDVDAG
jgi:uncharacterized OsmC-like protein